MSAGSGRSILTPEVSAHIDRLVAAAPPFSQATLDRLALLLRPELSVADLDQQLVEVAAPPAAERRQVPRSELVWPHHYSDPAAVALCVWSGRQAEPGRVRCPVGHGVAPVRVVPVVPSAGCAS